MTAISPQLEPSAAPELPETEDAPVEPGPRGGFWKSEGVPAWLSSLIFHTLLLIVLMLWQLSSKPGGLALTISQAPPSDTLPKVFEPVVLSQEPPAAAAHAEAAAPVELPELAQGIVERAIAEAVVDLQPEVPLNRQDITGRDQLAGMLAATPSTTRPSFVFALPSGGIAPRTASSRAQLGALYGATPESENAVEMALQWLAQHQQRNGSWSFDLSVDPCRGRCSHSRSAGDNATPATAATGLALLAFLGAGYTHHEGQYAENVRNGIYYLRDAAKKAQHGLDLQAGSMYGHGIATLALTEVLAIDRYYGQEDPHLRQLVEDAVMFTVVAQHPKGGWRYVPGSPGDMTVSGWQILSLVSARYSAIPLRTNTLSDAKEFLLSLSQEDAYAFGYTSKRPQRTTTAIGLCMLMYLGESPGYTPYTLALQRMADQGPKLGDVYHDYYATLALHNARHRAWEDWHQPLRDHLVRTQAKVGHEKGSWHFPDVHGDVGGRLYTTAMATLILEVYYRHLPLYQSRDRFGRR